MNRYNKLGYLPSLASLFFLATPGIFASDILQPQDQNSILNENANNNVQFSLFTTEDPLKIPDFASDALIVAHNPDGSDNHAGTAPASATPKKAETDTASTKPKTARDHHSLSAQATNPIANLMQFQIQNTFIPESYESSGYANSFVLQPVIPIKLSKDGFFPFMITRTTLPVLTTPNLMALLMAQLGWVI